MNNLFHTKEAQHYLKNIFIPNTSATITLTAHDFSTPLGPMIALGDEEFLYFLDFIDNHTLIKIENFIRKLKATLVPQQTAILKHIQTEMNAYFLNKISIFHTPLYLLGSDFQKKVWKQLMNIPMSHTQSYLQIAQSIKKPKAFRAVAQANARNRLCIVIPCHRVINNNGKLGGYSSGIERKQWLLRHEGSLL